MKMDKISVIVPIYNTEPFLEKCLNSIANQTYKNLEIICVDDGSSDQSGIILDRYASDSRFIIIHQSNLGESNARNTALKLATGDMVAFCDCDDWIEPTMYEILAKEMEINKLSMVCSGWFKDTEKGSTEIRNTCPVTSEVFDSDDLLRYIYMRDSYRGFSYMWNKLYRRSVLEESSGELRLFDESLRLGGDVVYLAKAALNSTRNKYIDRAFYHYYQRTSSGCHTTDTSRLRDWLKAYEIIIEIFESQKINNKTIDYTKRFFAYHSSNAVEIASKNNDEEAKKEFQTKMEKYRTEYFQLNQEYPDRLERFSRLLKD